MLEIKLGKEWEYGVGYGASLLRFNGGERKQCCWGVACTQLGVKDDVILSIGTLERLLSKKIVLPIALNLAGQTDVEYTSIGYKENDDNAKISRAERIARINRKANLVEVNFVDALETNQKGE